MTRFVEAFAGPGTSVIYVDENGSYVLYSEGDRTWRNNNPGNLRPGTVSRRTGVEKDKSGRIQKYFVPELGWLTKSRAIQLATKGELDAVVVERNGTKFLRSRPDVSPENNLSNMAKA